MRIAVITGASSGIGHEFARRIDLEGLDEIWLIARRKDRLQELSGILRTPSRVFPLDLAKKESAMLYRAELEKAKAKVVYLVNAAGFGKFGNWEECNLEMSESMIEINVTALVRMSQLSIPFMHRGSRIIQMGSSSAFNPLPNFNIYASTKAFVRHYSMALARELRPRGISVTCVCPGWVQTEFFVEADKSAVKNAPKSFKPMYSAKNVVIRALRDAKMGKYLSVYGSFPNMHQLLGKLLPSRAMMEIWMAMQK